jgi:phospholipid-binding lipoprotein MlaA
VALLAAVGLLLGGCGSLSKALRVEARAATTPAPSESLPAAAADEPSNFAGKSGEEPAPSTVAQATTPAKPDTQEDAETEAYDPWEPFNDKMFEFNLRVDRYVLKPAANVYRKIMPEPFQIIIANGFDNIRWVPRFVNSLLQGKFGGAGREVARFLINSTAGIGGLFDPAKDYWGIRPSKEDFGQTLGLWGAGAGPFLVLPFLPPMTVRDGVGRGVDTFLDPLSYFVPFFWEGLGMKAGDILNERALNYELFQGVEETTVDLYSSVRHFYLRRRELMINE